VAFIRERTPREVAAKLQSQSTQNLPLFVASSTARVGLRYRFMWEKLGLLAARTTRKVAHGEYCR
jgi:hypothetical protein